MYQRHSKKLHLEVFVSILIACLIVAIGCSKKDQGESAGEIHWIEDIDHSLALAKQQNKPLMIDFMATWCPPCQKMEDSTFSHPGVIQKAASFITVRIDVDKQGEVADRYNCNAGKYGGIGIPNVLFLDKEGKELKHPIGYRGPEVFLAVMDSVLVMSE